MIRPLQYRETATELRELADQLRWAENRDHLLHLAEQFAELAVPDTQGADAPALTSGAAK